MVTFDQHESLSGVKVDYENNNLYTGALSAAASTGSILLIGTATDGPIGEPVSVNALGGPVEAEKLFGGMLQRSSVIRNGQEVNVRVPHQGTLLRSMWEAIRLGCDDIRLLRASGKVAKTELAAKDPNSEVTQALADATGDQTIPGNVSFTRPLEIAANHRLVKIESIEETNAKGEVEKNHVGTAGYQSVNADPGNETITFARNTFKPTNDIKVSYKARRRTYQEVTRDMNGSDNPDTKGLLNQDPDQTNYFLSEVGNWSDEPIHQVLVYVTTPERTDAIPQRNLSGELLWRIGKSDSAVRNELTDYPFTAREFEQGGVRFTAAYQAEVAQGLYPALTGTVRVTADYTYFNDLEVAGTATFKVPGQEKETSLRFIPLSDELEVYYEVNGTKHVLSPVTDSNPNGSYTTKFPTSPLEKMKIYIKPGAGPIGAKLFAYYRTSEGGSNDAKLVVEGYSAGEVYGSLKDPKDLTSVQGVKVSVEYGRTASGVTDMDQRVIRFIKPRDKQLSANDIELVYNTAQLSGVDTLRTFANFVNSQPENNIVRLEVPTNAGDVPVAGLIPTGGEISLGEIYSDESLGYELYIDTTKDLTDPERFPWLGGNGFFEKASLKSMMSLYEALGGTYANDPDTGQIRVATQGVYSNLENYSVDQIVLLDAYANTAIGGISESTGDIQLDTKKSFGQQLAQHCAKVTLATNETLAVINMAPSPNATLREVQRYIDLVTGVLKVDEKAADEWVRLGINPYFEHNYFIVDDYTQEVYYNDQGQPVDIGHYVSTIFGPEVGLAQERLGSYVAPATTVYAGLISTIRPEVSTTNQQIPVSGMRYSLSQAQHNQLAASRYVAFDEKLLGGERRISVKEGVTSAQHNTDFQRLSTLRITHAAVSIVRTIGERYIGQPSGMAQESAMATDVQAGLDRLKEIGVLQNFSFEIFSSPQDRVIGNLNVTLELVPAFEIRKILTRVALRASL